MQPDQNLLITKILSTLNLIPLLPCIYQTIDNIVWFFAKHGIPEPTNPILSKIRDGLFGYLSVPGIILMFSRCFFLPYILSVLFTIVYVRLLVKTHAPVKEWIVFSLITILCILGLCSVELVFGGQMSV